MAFDFTGKKVLVTGAGKGLGRGFALALAKAGCKVYALDMVQEYLDTLTAENRDIVPILQDLSDWDGTRTKLEQLETLDGLVNNAAVFLGPIPSLEETEENMKTYMAVNVMPAINCTQIIGKKMVETGEKGAIVNMSSVVSQLSYRRHMGYNVAKACIDMVTKQFALELGVHGIRVNSLNPTFVAATDMAKSVLESASNAASLLIERTPLDRICRPDDVVAAVMYLLSDTSAMVTGTVNLLDGGLSCNITTKQ